MKWNGKKFKISCVENDISMAKIARDLDLTRACVSLWAKGTVPKGNHLIAISEMLSVDPDYFFDKDLSTRNLNEKINALSRKDFKMVDNLIDYLLLNENKP